MKNNMPIQLRRQVEIILNGAKEAKNCADKDGHLDIEKFNNHPIVKQIKEELLQLGVNKKRLEKNGFVVAAMILNKF